MQCQQLVHKHPEREAVHLLCVLLLPVVLHDLRRHEALRAAETLGTRGQTRSGYAVVGQLHLNIRGMVHFLNKMNACLFPTEIRPCK